MNDDFSKLVDRLPRQVIAVLVGGLAWMSFVASAAEFTPPAADGFRGVWYSIGVKGERHGYKYSGGLGTFPQIILPMAQYSPDANKTFFVWGGTDDRNQLQNNISYYDHATGQVARPRILRQFDMNDAHNTPSITIAPDGHLWVFSNVHGNDDARDGEIYRSTRPFSIDYWEKQIVSINLDPQHVLNYAQPWHVPEKGLLLLFTRYTNGRQLYFSSTTDNGRTWAPRTQLSNLPGHYQISWQQDSRIGTAFNRHPDSDVNARTDLYYMFTDDFGRTWKTADGRRVSIPLTSITARPLVRPYSNEGRLVYLKNMQLDAKGNPAILYVTSNGPEPGQRNAPRRWEIALWTGDAWRFVEIAQSDHNYDFGSLFIEKDGTWRVIAPTEPGPYPDYTGGEVAMWTSADRGDSWTKQLLTPNSPSNHTYIRGPLNAHPDFYAFWADGDPRHPRSGRETLSSRLYFTNRSGDTVWRLPSDVDDDFVAPEIAWRHPVSESQGAVPAILKGRNEVITDRHPRP